MASDDSLLGMIFNSLLKWGKTRHALFSIGGTIGLLLLLAYIFAYQASAFDASDPYNYKPPSPNPSGPDAAIVRTITVSGYANEGATVDEPFDLEGDRIWAMVVTLTFQDEPASRRRFTNEADNFEVTVQFPDGTSDSDSGYATSTNPGEISLYFNWTSEGGKDWTDGDPNGVNSVTVSIECTDAGDQVPFFNPFNLRVIEDGGNDYQLTVFYIYTEDAPAKK